MKSTDFRKKKSKVTIIMSTNRTCHCNTLQHIAASTLQHTAAHCSTLQHTAARSIISKSYRTHA